MGELLLQGEAINGLKWELEARENFKMGDKLTLYDQFMVSSNVSVDVIAKRFEKTNPALPPRSRRLSRRVGSASEGPPDTK